MHFFSNSLVVHALDYFDSIEIEQADHFFSTFGPGNLLNATDRPHERFNDYETLLSLLLDRNHRKYEQVHKGTPFFFLSWLAFDLRNYEKALYYLDATIYEDVKNAGPEWIELPGALFLKLTTQQHVAKRVIGQIRNLLEGQLTRFNSISNLSPMSINDFVDKFVINLMQDPSARTLISAFYIFLLELKERQMELHLRSSEGSSLGPIIGHLFSGGLIFESILKKLYPTKDNGDHIQTLRQIYNTTAFQTDFGTGIQTSADTLQEIFDAVDDDSLLTAFCTTSKIRNTTGHNLIWDNIFNSSQNYEVLVNQIINAVFYVVETKFVR